MDYLHLPLDYPRINQFPEWFTTQAGARYRVKLGCERPRIFSGRELLGGIPAKVAEPAEMRFEITRALTERSKD